MKEKDHIPSIGQIIKEKFEESGMTVTEFAKRIHTSRRNVYEIFSKNSLDTDMLYSISKVLGSDWLLEYFSKKFRHISSSSSHSHALFISNTPFSKNDKNQEEVLQQMAHSFSEYLIENKRTLNEIKALLHLVLEQLEKNRK